ncbi:MAG TPA: hypothetical protein VIW78_11250 [Burkholderiales bacterium]
MTTLVTGLQLLVVVEDWLSVALLIYGAYLACVSGSAPPETTRGTPR